MNNLKNFDKFNEELNFDTYTNAAKRLNAHGHEDRAKGLVKHALDMKRKQYEAEYTVWPDSPAKLKEIKAKDKHGLIYFDVTFTDLSREGYFTDSKFEFVYIGSDVRIVNGEESFHFSSSSSDFDGDETTNRLFTNRQDAMKFKNVLGQWLMENGYDKCIPAFKKMSLNSLYTDKKLSNKRFMKYGDDDD
jgi:hypothetical protein